MENLQVFDLNYYNINNKPFIDKIVETLHKTGILIVRDPLIDTYENDKFIDLMEKYYEQPYDVKMLDARPELSYQVGVTPEKVEKSTCSQDKECIENLKLIPIEDRPTIHTSEDPKWRYMWKIGNHNSDLKNIIPNNFQDNWEMIMNRWGNNLLDVVFKVTEIIEKGLVLEHGELTNRLNGGHHLLAPTGVDVLNNSNLNTVYASYHKDISFFTIHGKSRFPGLYVWLRNGKKMKVKIPDGCLLLQVGEQLEWLTGGYFLSGYHEVICDQSTLESLKKAQHNGKSTWRVSSTLFSHVDKNKFLEPLSHKYTIDTNVQKLYKKITAGEYIKNELSKIKLSKYSTSNFKNDVSGFCM